MKGLRSTLWGLAVASAIGSTCCVHAGAEEQPTATAAVSGGPSDSAAAPYIDEGNALAPASAAAPYIDEGNALAPAAPKAPSSPTPTTPVVDQSSDNLWHVYSTAYLWVPGIHGTTGVRGFNTDVSVTASDIFSNFRGGFLGVFTPSYNRFSVPIDFIWMRLRPSKPIPFDPDYSLRVTINMSIATPKVAYLIYSNPRIKVYGNAGARVWHQGTTLDLVPTIAGHSAYQGTTWTDFVMGGRFRVPLGQKLSVDVFGDGGEGAATLDYQVGGLISYRVKPKLTMQAGWRYLTVHYGNDGNVFNTTTQGAMFGGTYQFK